MGEPRNLTEWGAADVALEIEDALYTTDEHVFGDGDGLSYSPDRPVGSSLVLFVTSTKNPDSPAKRFRITVTELPADKAIDTSSSASRQHFIDTGHYLPLGERAGREEAEGQ